MQSPGTYQTGAVWCSLQRKDRKSGQRRGQAWAERRMRRSWSRAVHAQWMPWSPWLDPLIPAAPSYISPAPVPSQTVSPGERTECALGWTHLMLLGAHPAALSALHAPSPSWLLTCRRCALLGPGAAPSGPGGRPGPAARWMCCCRCWWDRVWKKLMGTESRSHRTALHPGTSNGCKCCLCSISVSSPSQEHPHHRLPPAALTLLGCLVQGQAGCPQQGAPLECQETPAVAGHQHWNPGSHPGIASHAGPRLSSSALCVPLWAALPHHPPA